MDRWGFGATDMPLRARLTVNTAEAAVDAAAAGLGLTRVLSYQTTSAVAAGSPVIVLQDVEPAPVPVSLLYARQTLMPQKLCAFLDFATPRRRATLQAGPDPSSVLRPGGGPS